MAKRMILMLALTTVFVAALGFVKFRQIQTAIAQGAAFQPPPEAVTTAVPSMEPARPVEPARPAEAAPPTDAETTLELPPIPVAEPVARQFAKPVAEPPPAREPDTVPDLEPVTQPLPVIPPAPPMPTTPAPPRTSGRHARPEPESPPPPRDGSEPALAFLVDDPLALFAPPTRPGRHRRRA